MDAESATQSFREAAREFDPTPKLFRELMRYKDEIASLRLKGASFDTIRELLEKDNVKVSWKTVSRFYRKVIANEKRRKRSATPVKDSSPGEAQPKAKTGNESGGLASALENRRSNQLGIWSPRKRGPHITDSKNL